MRNPLPIIGLCTSLLLSAGCAGGLRSLTGTSDTKLAESCARPQIERGQRRPVIDTLGWVVGIPGKIILWDRRINNHNVSEETEAAVAQYVYDLGLDSTKVRINQYAPIDEWRRLAANREVAWGWRYTLGLWTWLDETILPGRIFATDHYNPYTNTVSIFSDAPAVAIKEGGRARDFRSRRYPGTYAAVNSLPLVSMWHETVTTRYAFQYIDEDRPDVQQEGDRLLYASYGAHLGSDLAWFTYVPYTIGAAVGAIPGHIVGRYQSHKHAPPETVRAQTGELEP